MEQPFNQSHSQPGKAMFLPKMILKTTIEKLQPLYTVWFYFTCHSYVTIMPFAHTRMSFVYHPYVTRMYSYIILVSLVCIRMSFVCHSYVLVCHLYVTRMYSYVICMWLVCTRMSFVCHSSVVLPWTIVKRILLITDCSLDERIVRYKVRNYFYSTYKWLLLKVMIGVFKTFWNTFVKIKLFF